MADEFQESDLFFETNAAGISIGGLEDTNIYNTHQHSIFSDFDKSKRKKKQPVEKMKNKSVPVNIPENFSRRSRSFQCYEEEGEIVPPHEIVSRRRFAGEMACSGDGRRLKGRELNEVRNSILRMTGFLET
ncbi:uncharacterized protein LOC111899359 [Lactuca sativa]|uniref:uncharacterized protein LOC111899359 n=1 Tax=Lactuca sativa TaxID=4236 RepID=UPI000CBF3FCB|nr:uncharacterized protein LOC111899359 [Lactuca sativa]